MYARVWVRLWCLGAVLLSGCVVAQAQCVGGWVVDPYDTSHGICLRYPADSIDANLQTTMTITCTPLYDSIRGQNSPAIPGVPNLKSSARWESGWTPTVGNCVFFSVVTQTAANGSQWYGLWKMAPEFGWPLTHGVTQGYYSIDAKVQNNSTTTYSIRAWLTGGVWSLNPPQGSAPPVPAVDPGQGSTQSNGVLKVHVRRLDGQAVGGVYVTYAGPVSGSMQASSSGDCQAQVDVGSYAVRVVGNYVNSQGNVVSANASASCFVASGSTVNCTITLDDSGGVSKVDGGDASGSGSGGWLADVLRSMLVPKQASVDALKKAMSSVYSWGPFNLVQQLLTLGNTGSNGGIALTVPVMSWDGSKWQDCPSCGVPLHDGGITAVPMWGLLRGIMGAGVWLVFAGGVIRYLMPRHVI